MASEELATCVERIEQLIARIERLDDERLRDDMREIVHCLLEYHASALARLINLLSRGDSARAPLLGRLAEDELVGSLLLLHGLHPADTHTRVSEALDHVRPFLESHGGDVELAAVVEGVVRLRLRGSCHGCPSSTATLKSRIEQAIFEAAPEVAQIEVVAEDPPVAASAGFVALETLSTG
jgi:Fe-S cluster biogenesis protein NfuA